MNSAAICPFPIRHYPQVLLAHGGGGRLMHQLIENMFKSAFRNSMIDSQHDATVVELPSRRLALTTDSYVVQPLFFPGGDIGSMSVYGTVNDLAMAGARPLYLSAGFILEEGLPMDTLWSIVRSMQQAAARASVQIITGDTKVVDKARGDGLYINTAGVGVVEHAQVVAPRSVRAGDVILVSGDLGRHGIAIMSARDGLEFETQIQSDCTCVADLVMELLDAGLVIHCLRDLTRGGLASALNEISQTANLEFSIEEKRIPLSAEVHAACEILGLDPLQVACEGRFVAFVPKQEVDHVLAIMHAHPGGAGASVIGSVADARPPQVLLKSALGVERILDMASGEQLPRIC